MASEGNASCYTGNCSNHGNSSYGNETIATVQGRLSPSHGDEIKLTFQVLIAICGVVGNLLAIIVLQRMRKKKHAGNFFVQNLALADLGILTVVFTFATIKDKSRSHWPLGEIACRYLYPLLDIFHGASVWFVAVIALSRYRTAIAGKSSLGQSKWRQILQRPKAVSFGVWLLSFLVFCLPLYFYMEYRELPNGEKRCVVAWPSAWVQSFYMGGVLTFCSYIFPLLSISFSYIRISHLIRKTSLIAKETRQSSHYCEMEQKSISAESRVSNSRYKHSKFARRIVTPLVIVFAVTMLPLNVIRVALIIWPTIVQQTYYHILFFVTSVFVMLNSSVNPLIYAIVSNNFREGIVNLCLRR